MLPLEISEHTTPDLLGAKLEEPLSYLRTVLNYEKMLPRDNPIQVAT